MALLRKRYPCKEYGNIPVPLTDMVVNGQLDLYPEIIDKRYLLMHLNKGQVIFQAGGIIGLIPVNDRVAIEVEPRVPISNVERLVRMAEHMPNTLPTFPRSYGTHPEWSGGIVDQLAEELLAGIAQIDAQGLERAYPQRTMDTSFPRGKIQVGVTVQRHLARGVPHRVTASWFQPSVDTVVNRCIKYAVWYLLAHHYQRLQPYAGMRQMVRRLNRGYQLFGGVTLDQTCAFLDDPLVRDPTRMSVLRSYYQNTLAVATTIIRNRGVAFTGEGTELQLPSLILNLEVAFEAYIRRIIQEHFIAVAPDLRVFDGKQTIAVEGTRPSAAPLFARPPQDNPNAFDDHLGRHTGTTPDVVVQLPGHADDNATYPMLCEVKYKPIKGLPDRSEMEQAIVYGVAHDAPHVVIVCPRTGTAHRLMTIGHIGEIVLHLYLFDLAADDIEAEEYHFAADLFNLVAPALYP